MTDAPRGETPLTFESALTELDRIVAGMEAGQMPLDQALAAYRRGAELLQFCQAALQDAQQQVRILEANTLQPFSGADETR